MELEFLMKTKFLISLIVLCSGCSTGYVLHWRQQQFEFFRSRDTTKEVSPISSLAGVVMTNDRAPVIRLDPEMPDGSAWVHYRLTIKNTSPQKISVNLRQVRLEYGSHRANAVYDKEEKISENYTLDGKTTYSIPVMFHIDSKTIETNGGDHPMKLILPVNDKGDLAMEIWLWHV
jgi:hypothetical protein